VPVAYHPDFGQAVTYNFEAIPEDPDTQVRLAVQRIVGFILEDLDCPFIQKQAALLKGGDPIRSVWEHVKPHIRFRQDTDIAEDLQTNDPRKHNIVETLIRPSDQARLIQTRGRGVEDCDGFTGYGACLLTALSIPCTLATVAAEEERPNEFTHIYVVAYHNGKRIPMDMSHGPRPGWECPHTRIKEWPVSWGTLQSSLWPVLLLAALGWFALKEMIR